MTEKCFYCGEEVTLSQCVAGKGSKTIHGLYVHTDCIGSRGDGTIVTEQTQRILGAADSAHQGLGLAVSLLQESLGNMGEIRTQGAGTLSESSLSRVMHLGQKIKESFFLVEDLGVLAYGLCGLLGKDLGVCEDDSEPWADLDEGSHEGRGVLPVEPAYDHIGPVPGKGEFDDDEQPF